MKYGYSHVAERIMPATTLRHGDCGDGWVTCPECEKPVFKVERKDGDATIHYLSHYRKGKDDAQCELRVNSMTPDDVAHRNAAQRGQTLERYYEGIDEMIADCLPGLGIAMGRVHLVRRNKNIRKFLALAEDHYRENFDTDLMLRRVADSKREVTDEVNGITLNLVIDEEVIKAMSTLLVSEKGASGLRRISSAAFALRAYSAQFGNDSKRDRDTQLYLRRVAEMTPAKLRIMLLRKQEQGDFEDLKDAAHRIHSSMCMFIATFDYVTHFKRVMARLPALAA